MVPGQKTQYQKGHYQSDTLLKGTRNVQFLKVIPESSIYIFNTRMESGKENTYGKNRKVHYNVDITVWFITRT